MKKSVVIALSVTGSIVLATCIALSLYFALKTSVTPPTPSPLSPKDQCSKNGYIWDPVKQVCTTNQCLATVDPATGVLSGTMVNVSGTSCVPVSSGSYLSPFARAALLKDCVNAGFQNLGSTTAGLICTKASGCNTKPYVTNTFMDGCPYLTYQPGDVQGSTCIPPTNDQLQYLCNTSVNGCPVNTSLNSNCGTDQPCYDPVKGTCQAQLDAPGCRPQNEQWQWSNGQCVNATVSNVIVTQVTSATVEQVQGTFTLDNPPQNTKLLWSYLLVLVSSDSTKPAPTWQGPVIVQGSSQAPSFTVNLSSFNLPVQSQYNFTLQAYTSVNNGPYVLSFASVVPSVITLQAAPVAPGLVTIKPTLSLELAQQVAADVPGAILAANKNSSQSNPFVPPDPSVWTNTTLPGTVQSNSFLIVPCTTAYCKNTLSDGVAMLILAWPVAKPLNSDQVSEIKKACPSISDPQVSYAVYSGTNVVQSQLTQGTWLQPIPSDPTLVTTLQIKAYVWSSADGDTGIENSQCTSQPLNVVVQVPSNLYSADTCYAIQPFKPEGQFMPGNFMVYHPGNNLCSSPANLVEALQARDFSCLIQQGAPDLTKPLQLYGCNDTQQVGSNCNSSGQACATVSPVSTVRQPQEGESQECNPLPNGTVPPCGGSQYCQLAACNCPPTVPWYLCGAYSFAQVGQDKAIEASRWQDRVSNVSNFIQTYGLDKVSTLPNLTPFLTQTSTTQNIKTAWDTTYGAAVCPLPKWSAPSPGSCDITSSSACTQQNVCSEWTPGPADQPGLYKQQVYVYPTKEQQAACCPTNFTYYAGCCCPDTSTSCIGQTTCTPVTTGTLGPTWCNSPK